jgi:hypothetical protein
VSGADDVERSSPFTVILIAIAASLQGERDRHLRSRGDPDAYGHQEQRLHLGEGVRRLFHPNRKLGESCPPSGGDPIWSEC